MRQWREDPVSVKIVPGDVGVASSLPGVDSDLLNWPGDWACIRSICQTALLPIVLLLLLDYWLGVKLRVMDGSEVLRTPARGADDHPRRWNALGSLILLGSFILLEVNEPFYFTQCDTANEDLPMILVGCRSYWQLEFPDYNPYQSAGTPLAATGLASLTYPPMLLAYAVARHALFNENATAEVFAILHLAAGFFLMRRLGRKVGLSAFTANLSALSFALSGAALIMGRSWLNFTPIVFWLPLLFLGLLRWRDRPVSWPWVLGMGLALGLPFHIGFPQIAIYLDGCFCLAALFLAWTGKKNVLPVLPALVIGAGVALPLILQQWLLQQGAARHDAPGDGIAMGLPAMLLPYPLAQAQTPARWGNENLQFMGHVYFFGGVLAWLFLYQTVGLLFFRPSVRADWAGQVWTLMGLLALWLSLGDVGGLWTVLRWLPFGGTINRHPIRLLFFLVFFFSLAGGLAFDRLLDHLRERQAVWTERACYGIAVGLLLWHVGQCRTAFHVVAYRPYPRLPTELQDIFWKHGQVTGRVLSWGRYSHNEEWALQLPKNLAGVYEVPSLEGQNPLLDGGPVLDKFQRDILRQPLAGLKKYGVRWHLRQDSFTPVGPANSYSWLPDVLSREDAFERRLTFEQFALLMKNDEVVVRELGDADPLAFVENEPARNLELWMHGWGLEVDVAPVAAEKIVVVNFLRWPGMRAYVDGEETVCHTDDWQRILVRVGPGSKTLTIRYHPPWGTGLLFGLATMAAGLALTWFLLARQPKT